MNPAMAEVLRLAGAGVTGRVSVIMPAHNAARWLSEAIDSVLGQDWPDVELLVADDGSADGTADVAAAYGGRLRLLRLPHRGVVAARNLAIAASTGEFIAFLDADDRFAPGHLRTAVAALQRHPDAGLVATSVQLMDAAGRALETDRVPAAAGGDFLALQFERNRIYTCAAVVRRSVLQAGGLFDPDWGNHAEDYELWTRIGARFPVVWVDAVTTHVRRHGDNLSSAVPSMLRNELRIVARIVALRPALRWRLPDRYARYFLTLARYAASRRRLVYLIACLLLAFLVCPWRYLRPEVWRDILQKMRRLQEPASSRERQSL